MNESQIALLFGLFAGSDVDTGKYQSLLELAVTEVRQALREDADESDARLNYLAAAVALVHYTELTAPRDLCRHHCPEHRRCQKAGVRPDLCRRLP